MSWWWQRRIWTRLDTFLGPYGCLRLCPKPVAAAPDLIAVFKQPLGSGDGFHVSKRERRALRRWNSRPSVRSGFNWHRKSACKSTLHNHVQIAFPICICTHSCGYMHANVIQFVHWHGRNPGESGWHCYGSETLPGLGVLEPPFDHWHCRQDRQPASRTFRAGGVRFAATQQNRSILWGRQPALARGGDRFAATQQERSILRLKSVSPHWKRDNV